MRSWGRGVSTMKHADLVLVEPDPFTLSTVVAAPACLLEDADGRTGVLTVDATGLSSTLHEEPPPRRR